MNKFTLWFRKHTWLTGMVLSQSRELADLRKQIEHKNLCLQRSQTDYANARSFYTAQNKVLNDRVTELSAECERWYTRFFETVSKEPEPVHNPLSYTTEDGIKIFADTNQSDDMLSLDIIAWGPGGRRDFLASVEYTRPNPLCKDDGGDIRIMAYNGSDDNDEPAFLHTYDKNYILDIPDAR